MPRLCAREVEVPVIWVALISFMLGIVFGCALMFLAFGVGWVRER